MSNFELYSRYYITLKKWDLTWHSQLLKNIQIVTNLQKPGLDALLVKCKVYIE